MRIMNGVISVIFLHDKVVVISFCVDVYV